MKLSKLNAILALALTAAVLYMSYQIKDLQAQVKYNKAEQMQYDKFQDDKTSTIWNIVTRGIKPRIERIWQK